MTKFRKSSKVFLFDMRKMKENIANHNQICTSIFNFDRDNKTHIFVLFEKKQHRSDNCYTCLNETENFDSSFQVMLMLHFSELLRNGAVSAVTHSIESGCFFFFTRWLLSGNLCVIFC